MTAGLVNGHHHSHEGFFKGRDDILPLELWMRALRPIALSARDVYLRTMIGAIEAVRSGTTTLGDDANVGGIINPEHVEAVFQAYDDIGIRAYVGVTLFDKPFIRAVPFVRRRSADRQTLRAREYTNDERRRAARIRQPFGAYSPSPNKIASVTWCVRRRRNAAPERSCGTSVGWPMISTYL